jgi:hypothetical protein
LEKQVILAKFAAGGNFQAAQQFALRLVFIRALVDNQQQPAGF